MLTTGRTRFHSMPESSSCDESRRTARRGRLKFPLLGRVRPRLTPQILGKHKACSERCQEECPISLPGADVQSAVIRKHSLICLS